jgi:metallo-beta-lactamase class B
LLAAAGLVAWWAVARSSDAAPPPPPAKDAAPPSIFARPDGGLLNVLGGLVGPDGGIVSEPAGHPGSLDKEIIRRIIRSHINEVKDCYERHLVKKPDLGGRIMVQFTISATGDVIASVLQNSTMGNPAVESCTVQAVRRWQFPKPLGGGIVIVSYPFILTPSFTPLLPGKGGAGALDIAGISRDHLFMHRSTDAHSVSSNGVVVVTDEGLVLIDTAWTDAQTAALLDWGTRHFSKPWVGAVITHDHADRDGGIATLLQRKIPVSALDLTVAKLARRGVKGVATLLDARPGATKEWRGLEIFYPGPGHAPDNIVVAFPHFETVFGGCLVKAADATDLGFTGDADIKAWPAAIARVEQKYPWKRIVPGHGPLDIERKAYAHTLDLLRARR